MVNNFLKLGRSKVLKGLVTILVGLSIYYYSNEVRQKETEFNFTEYQINKSIPVMKQEIDFIRYLDRNTYARKNIENLCMKESEQGGVIKYIDSSFILCEIPDKSDSELREIIADMRKDNLERSDKLISFARERYDIHPERKKTFSATRSELYDNLLFHVAISSKLNSVKSRINDPKYSNFLDTYNRIVSIFESHKNRLLKNLELDLVDLTYARDAIHFRKFKPYLAEFHTHPYPESKKDISLTFPSSSDMNSNIPQILFSMGNHNLDIWFIKNKEISLYTFPRITN